MIPNMLAHDKWLENKVQTKIETCALPASASTAFRFKIERQKTYSYVCKSMRILIKYVNSPRENNTRLINWFWWHVEKNRSRMIFQMYKIMIKMSKMIKTFARLSFLKEKYHTFKSHKLQLRIKKTLICFNSHFNVLNRYKV